MTDETENTEAPETEIDAETESGAAQAEDTAENELAPEDRIAELEAENSRLRDGVLRAMAEAENVRKRAERETANARAYANERFANDLLGVADNLSRALDAVPEDAPDSVRNVVVGVEMTQRELMKVFERHNIHPIEPEGEAFDPNRHQAVAQFPSDVPSGRVAQVMQTGYRLGDRVLRAAMVAVSTGPGAGAAPAGDTPPKEEPSADAKDEGGDSAAPGATADFKV